MVIYLMPFAWLELSTEPARLATVYFPNFSRILELHDRFRCTSCNRVYPWNPLKDGLVPSSASAKCVTFFAIELLWEFHTSNTVL